jgi:hypothetical protein
VLHRLHAPIERRHVGSKVECWKSKLSDRANGPLSGRKREDQNVQVSGYAPLREANSDGSEYQGVQGTADLRRRGASWSSLIMEAIGKTESYSADRANRCWRYDAVRGDAVPCIVAGLCDDVGPYWWVAQKVLSKRLPLLLP